MRPRWARIARAKKWRQGLSTGVQVVRRVQTEIVDGRNRLAYHGIVAILAVVLTAVFWFGDRTLNQAAAAAAVVSLALVMSIGPLMRLWWRPVFRRLPFGIPFRWRGELGIWFTVLAILHALLVWQGRGWQILPLRHSDLVGLIALGWALVLAATSSGKAMRLLGIQQWKWLQTTGAYVIFYLVLVHTAYHTWLRPGLGPAGMASFYLALFLIVLTLQTMTFVKFVLDAHRIRWNASSQGILLLSLLALAMATWILLAGTRPTGHQRVQKVHDWLPEKRVVDLQVQAAFNDEEFFFRFQWNQPYPGGWYHDLLVYQEGEWRRFSEANPWVQEGQHGFTEDRLSFKLDDGSVQGFANFGGWLTQHQGVRGLPGAADRAAIETHPWFGQTLGRSDMRKYLPQSRQGEWWEGAWDQVLPPDELERLKAEGVFLDLVIWRAHRSNPVEAATDHWILDYRHTDEGTTSYRSQAWDPVEGPQYMFDPEIIARGALDMQRITADPAAYRQDVFFSEREQWLGEAEPYFLHEDFLVPFDPTVAQWEGAAIPRSILRPPAGSAGAWRARGFWRNGIWTVEMWRQRDTDSPDDKSLQTGRLYTWSPAVHHGCNQRWHWVAFPYQLGLGMTAEEAGVEPRRYLQAVRISDESPDWQTLPSQTIPLIYPGMIDWTWLTSERHLGYREVRRDAVSLWDGHDQTPAELADFFLTPP